MKPSLARTAALFVFGGVLLAPSVSLAQEKEEGMPPLIGQWVGEFEDEAKWEEAREDEERIRGVRNDRERARCEGTLKLSFLGSGEGTIGNGMREQTCRNLRGGGSGAQVPMRMTLSKLEVKKEGEEIRFAFLLADRISTLCKAKMKWDKKKVQYKGDYNCRARGQGRSAVDRTTRGKFTVARSG